MPVVKFKPTSYKYPDSLPLEYYPKVKPTVTIDSDEIEIAAKKGVSWLQLADYYCVDENTLKEHFYIIYTKSRAMLEINVLDSMVTCALEGNPMMQKWLSSNWLGMTEKVNPIPVVDVKDIDTTELDDKIHRLMKKMDGNLEDK